MGYARSLALYSLLFLPHLLIAFYILQRSSVRLSLVFALALTFARFANQIVCAFRARRSNAAPVMRLAPSPPPIDSNKMQYCSHPTVPHVIVPHVRFDAHRDSWPRTAYVDCRTSQHNTARANVSLRPDREIVSRMRSRYEESR